MTDLERYWWVGCALFVLVLWLVWPPSSFQVNAGEINTVFQSLPTTETMTRH